jgi:hypothetical protein
VIDRLDKVRADRDLYMERVGVGGAGANAWVGRRVGVSLKLRS